MGDMYREIMVKPVTPFWKKAVKVLLPALAVLCFLGGLLFIPLLLGTVGFGIAAYFVGQRMDVEYEYLYVDGEIDIDAIYSKQKRKRIASYDMEKMDFLAPVHSHALDSYNNRQNVKILDYTSKESPENSYALVFNDEGGTKIVEVELDDAIIADMRRIAPHKINMV